MRRVTLINTGHESIIIALREFRTCIHTYIPLYAYIPFP